MSVRVLSLPEVLATVGIKKSLLYQLVGEARFPAPVSLSVRRRAWVSSEVESWLAERIAERDAARANARAVAP